MKVEILSWEFMMCFQLDKSSIGIKSMATSLRTPDVQFSVTNVL